MEKQTMREIIPQSVEFDKGVNEFIISSWDQIFRITFRILNNEIYWRLTNLDTSESFFNCIPIENSDTLENTLKNCLLEKRFSLSISNNESDTKKVKLDIQLKTLQPFMLEEQNKINNSNIREVLIHFNQRLNEIERRIDCIPILEQKLDQIMSRLSVLEDKQTPMKDTLAPEDDTANETDTGSFQTVILLVLYLFSAL